MRTDLLRPGDLDALRDAATGGGRFAHRARLVLRRVTLVNPLIDAAEGTCRGRQQARVSLRDQLLHAAPAEPAAMIAGLAYRVPMRLGGLQRVGGEPMPALEPTGWLTAPQTALAVGSVLCADTPDEAVAFALLATSAVRELAALSTSTMIIRRGPGPIGGGGGGGGGPLRLPPLPTDGPPLRLPPDLEIRTPPGQGRPKVPGWEQIDGWLEGIMAFTRADCLRALYGAAALLAATTNPYRIDQVVPDDACAGEAIELFGAGFGDVPADVVFTAASGGTVLARVYDWSASQIRLRVPTDAVAGPVGIARQIGELTSACSAPMAVFQRGTDGQFGGGRPVVSRLTMNELDRPGVIDAAAPLRVEWTTIGAQARVEILAGTDRLYAADVATGPGEVSLSLRHLRVRTDLMVSVTARTRCGEDRRELTAAAVAAPVLDVASVELVQTIQRHDVSGASDPARVPLVPGVRTAARVYVTPRHEWFDWGAGPGVLPVTGRLETTVEGRTRELPLGGVAVSSALLDRGARLDASGAQVAPHGVLVEIPFTEVTAAVHARAVVRADPGQLGAGQLADVPLPWATGEGGAPGWPKLRVRQLLPVLIDLPRYRPQGISGVTYADWVATVVAGMARLPIAWDEWRLLRPGRVAGNPNLDLLHADDEERHDAWGGLLDQVQDVADDRDVGDDVLTIGVLPDLAGLPAPGGRTFGIAANGGMATVVTVGQPRTFAHEVAHCFAVDHGGCPAEGESGAPDHIDFSLPVITEEVGLDLHHRAGPRVVPRGTAETMTYCWPSWAGGQPDAFQLGWTSIRLWERLRTLFGRFDD